MTLSDITYPEVCIVLLLILYAEWGAEFKKNTSRYEGCNEFRKKKRKRSIFCKTVAHERDDSLQSRIQTAKHNRDSRKCRRVSVLQLMYSGIGTV